MPNSLFRAWLPQWLVLPLLLLLLVPVLTLGGIYTPNVGDMVGGLGTLSEYLTLANYLAIVGTAVGFTVGMRFLMWLPSKYLLLLSLGGQLLVHVLCATTASPVLLVGLSFVSGFCKILAMLVLVLPLMPLISPQGHRPTFYALFYPLLLTVGQASGVLTSYLAYSYGWQAVYMWLIPVLLLCLLLTQLCFTAERQMPYNSLVGIDWLGMAQLAGTLGLFCYVCAFGRVEEWYASPRIQGASIASGVLGLWFVRRQLFRPNPLVNFRMLQRRNVWLGCLLFVVLGIFQASTAVQSVLTSSILHFDSQTSAALSLWMIPGILVGSFFCYWWFQRELSFKVLYLLGFGAFTVAHMLLYFLVAPGTGYHDLVLPTVLRGMGMVLVFIGGGLYLTDKLTQATMLPTAFFMTMARSLLCVVLFSTLYSNWVYRGQVRNTTELANRLDALDPQLLARVQPAMRAASGRGLAPQVAAQQALYGLVQPQAALLTVREIFGYVCWAGLATLLGVALLRLHPLNHRWLVGWRQRWRGQGRRQRAAIPEAAVLPL